MRVCSGLIVSLVAGVLALGAGGAEARLHDMRLSWSIESVRAIHMPTGCTASMEFHDGSFVAAFITDPLCLPNGVLRRPVPGAAQDFYATDPVGAPVTIQ